MDIERVLKKFMQNNLLHTLSCYIIHRNYHTINHLGFSILQALSVIDYLCRVWKSQYMEYDFDICIIILDFYCRDNPDKHIWSKYVYESLFGL